MATVIEELAEVKKENAELRAATKGGMNTQGKTIIQRLKESDDECTKLKKENAELTTEALGVVTASKALLASLKGPAAGKPIDHHAQYAMIQGAKDREKYRNQYAKELGLRR